MPACRYVEEIGMAAMLVAKRLAGVTPEVNLREYVICMPLPRLPTLTLKPKGDVTRSPKQGYQWPHKKGVYSPIFKKKTWKSVKNIMISWNYGRKCICDAPKQAREWVKFKKKMSAHRTNYTSGWSFPYLLGNIGAFPKWIQWQKHLSLQ